MAVDITVHLTDSEQQFIVDLANVIAPGLPPQDLINWVSLQCKKGLRESLVEQYVAAGDAAEVALRETRAQTLETQFPEIP